MRNATIAATVNGNVLARYDLAKLALRAAGVVSFACLTALGAQVRIQLPFTPVPITLQTFFVLLSGICLGAYCGATSMVLYLGLGICGIPFFAGGGAGFAVLLGPTGGYLLGFIVASSIVGVSSSAQSVKEPLLALLLATATIYFLGAMHLALFLGVDLLKAIWLGVLPFLPGDAIKIAIALIAWRQLAIMRGEK